MRRITSIAVLIALLLAAVPASGHGLQSSPTRDTYDTQIAEIIATLTPEERVGQLMLVTFEGSNLNPETSIATLIADYNIGGVVMLAANDNINGQVNTPRLVQSLTTDLQQLAYDSAVATAERDTPRSFVPMFIATTHAGEGQIGSEIAKDTTPLPSLMALGATWNTGYARQIGQIAGIELSAMGINMLLGPALNIAQQTQSGQSIDLGVNTFGGEPSWVGQMGQSYITGVHEGSQGHIAVIAQDFPGLGLADTQPDQEIPVVPRSVVQLHQFDLIPYYSVTGAAGDTLARADGIQCANIRYQGETSRTITEPVCLNEDATAQIVNLDYFAEWREDGVIVSNPLGTRAIRRYYDVIPFPHRQVAREAFLAGNDILYLSDFGPALGSNQLDNVIDVIQFFAERYEDDPVFRSRVDQSLYRILQLKLTLYNGDLSHENVMLPVNDINAVGGYSADLYTIAEQAVTLLAPRRESLPSPPSRDDNIVIFTDVRLVQQCSYCPTYPLVAVNALETAIERRYGPYADAQIRPEQVVSFSFSQLTTYLDGAVSGSSSESSQIKTNQRIGEALRDVDWIIYVMMNATPEVPESTIVNLLLERESSLVERANVIVVSLSAPTYLSSTEVSKFSAYYGLYSHTPPYIEAAARAIFQDTTFSGAPPVSIAAIGYNVQDRTAPDPAQFLQITVDSTANDATIDTDDETGVVTVNAGERITLQTTAITDHNGHIVPDGTVAEFTITFITDNLQTQQTARTVQGIAETSITTTRPGRIQVTVRAGEASRSNSLQIVANEPTTIAAAEEPNPADGTPSAESERIPHAARPENGIRGTEVANAATTGDPVEEPPTTDTLLIATTADSLPEERLSALDFVVSLFALALMSITGFTTGRSATGRASGGVRAVLGSVVAGLTGYVYYGVGGPGANELYNLLHNLAPMVMTLIGGFVGLLYTWWILRKEYSRDDMVHITNTTSRPSG